ncbi:hypothetical protein DQD56_24675 [Salmonella enterica subsp. enterica serovar Schwarzengrund]|uniref:Uncharacterized protein n=2 Tax=Salmonella enterica TaxID=28901 RepID=A0A5V9HH47_SALAN|nr:hypothetical protein [Salmonella enterica]EAY3018144.1 hypothetical protein [Salmonella enterica subsp. enterica serovar Typhimurium]EBR0246165.1 hypothetical protein [Salmonella enterica subsp. enterica serovar Agona]EBS4348352.1 hypothetical protein [Salmonella enterica subsp. enterica serovar Schwarzengrund]EBV1374337.1 hypothetical protein [Salmonella enterica subsp. enterica serovar Kentucky]EBV6103476.1 hypothetical protein [Salmonella enterica subsp. enterica serovar Anatum]ECA75161
MAIGIRTPTKIPIVSFTMNSLCKTSHASFFHIAIIIDCNFNKSFMPFAFLFSATVDTLFYSCALEIVFITFLSVFMLFFLYSAIAVRA